MLPPLNPHPPQPPPPWTPGYLAYDFEGDSLASSGSSAAALEAKGSWSFSTEAHGGSTALSLSGAAAMARLDAGDRVTNFTLAMWVLRHGEGCPECSAKNAYQYEYFADFRGSGGNMYWIWRPDYMQLGWGQTAIMRPPTIGA